MLGDLLNMNIEKNKEDVRYKSYLDERRNLIEGEKEASARYDKWILTLSGGALALSITFIEKIAPSPKPFSLWFLGGAYLFLILTILVALSSHLTSQAAFRRQRTINDEKFDSESSSNKTNKIASFTNALNIMSMIFFVIGIVLLCIFSLINSPKKGVYNGKGSNEEKRISSTQTAQTTEAKVPNRPKAKEGQIEKNSGANQNHLPEIKAARKTELRASVFTDRYC